VCKGVLIMDNFNPSELLPKDIADKYGELGYRYLDDRILACLSYIRKTIGKKINVNGAITGRTIRYPSDPSYSKTSDHVFGRAIDFDVPGMSSDEVRHFIVKDIVNSTELKKLGLTGFEDDTQGWVHITCANLKGWGFKEINGICLIPIK
jgi:hypothetical protein